MAFMGVVSFVFYDLRAGPDEDNGSYVARGLL